MFTSVTILKQQWDIDPDIARFFVDRPVPDGNRYWKGRLLYISKGLGFLFIPLVYDILLRLGLKKTTLLDESHVLRMEAILDSAGKVEFDGLPGTAHVAVCRDVMDGHVKNEWLWEALQEYFEKGPKGPLGLQIPPLNRADTFLFSICDFDMDLATTHTFLRYWYALIAAFLMMDDIKDWESDKKLGEENSIQYLGGGQEAYEKALKMLRTDFDTLSAVNPKISVVLEGSLQKLIN